MTETDPWAPSPDAAERAHKDAEASGSPDTPAAAEKPLLKPARPEATSTAQRKVGISMRGKLVDPASIPHKPFPSNDELAKLEYDLVELTDSSELREVMAAMLLTRSRLYKMTEILGIRQRQAVEAKYEWKTSLSDILSNLAGGTAGDRQAYADSMTKEEWGAYLSAEQEAEDALNLLRAVRDEGDMLKNLSYNIRSQMQIM